MDMTTPRPVPGLLWVRSLIGTEELNQEDWLHWQNEVFLPSFLYEIERKSENGSPGPTLLMRYLNTDENASEDWENLCLIVAPDLNWFANERWARMKCFEEELAPGVGTVRDAVISYTRSYELVEFHDTTGQRDEERGEFMIVYGETPAEGGEAEYERFYEDHHKHIQDIQGLQFFARYRYVLPTSIANRTLEADSDIPRFLIMYYCMDKKSDKAAIEAARSTEAAKKVLSKLQQSEHSEWFMSLSAENEEANLRRKKQFREKA